MSSSVISTQKKIKVRQAIISEESAVNSTQKKGKVSVKLFQEIVGNKDHLETKKQIEELRKKFGSEWLQRESAHLVKNVIGFESSSPQSQSTKSHGNYFELDDTAESDKQLNISSDQEIIGGTSTSTPQNFKYMAIKDPVLDNQTKEDSKMETLNTTARSENTMYTTALESDIIEDGKNNSEEKAAIWDNIYQSEYEEPVGKLKTITNNVDQT